MKRLSTNERERLSSTVAGGPGESHVQRMLTDQERRDRIEAEAQAEARREVEEDMTFLPADAKEAFIAIRASQLKSRALLDASPGLASLRAAAAIGEAAIDGRRKGALAARKQVALKRDRTLEAVRRIKLATGCGWRAAAKEHLKNQPKWMELPTREERERAVASLYRRIMRANHQKAGDNR